MNPRPLRTAVASCCALLLATGAALAQRSTTNWVVPNDPAPRPARVLSLAAPEGEACAQRVGVLGVYLGLGFQTINVLTAAGHVVSQQTAATIAGGSLANLDVLYLDRSGVPEALPNIGAIESFVRGGGTLITEFDATSFLFLPPAPGDPPGTRFGFFPPATEDEFFAVPSGDVCGNNTVLVTSPANGVVAGLPASWACSGDPIGVFKVFDAASLPATLEIAARIDADANGDGEQDPLVGTACIDEGVVVAFFSDFGDFTDLQDPRPCPLPFATCQRTREDERLLLNAVCITPSGCGAGGNQPPDCSGAAPSIATLWPPDHRMVAVEIVGVTDPDGDPLTIEVTGVTQDEPLDGRGDGRTCPDALATGASVQLRAERTGVPGNGRVYVVHFTATDALGASCDGTVAVCVPHDQSLNTGCVDDGQTVDALETCSKHKVSPEVAAGADGPSLRILGRAGATIAMEYSLPADAEVTLAVYDVAGRVVATIEHRRAAAGVHGLSWNRAGLASGMYFYRLRAGSQSVGGPLLLMD